MKADFLGARASNTGDDFHEWWALRSALKLILPHSELTAVSVEGVNLDKDIGEGVSQWDAVDCGLYFGGSTIEKSDKVIFEQLKYSSATPKKSWTVSELTSSKSKSKNNSIIKGLADSFIAVKKLRPDLIKNNQLAICLVSNRPIGLDLEKSLTNKTPLKYEKLRVASSLNKLDFKKFIKLFDYTNCGTGSRFEQEEKAIIEILNISHSTTRGFVLDMKDRVHRLMLPEGTGKFITKETILSWMNVSDPRSLFPCPQRLKPTQSLVNRSVATRIFDSMQSGKQYLYIHGEGGSGKTTILNQIEKILPESSTMVIFDCYGAGTYLDSDSYRHRSKDACLQIINEISTRLRLPLLINDTNNLDCFRALKSRLETASSVLKAQNKNALLVIVVDAADNSVTAAKNCHPEEISFIHEFLKLGDLPINVRFLISTRTGRIDTLKLTDKYSPIRIDNFSLDETSINVKNHYIDVEDSWVEDFHQLSNKNPRVQSYAFDYAKAETGKAINFLKPNGKCLEQIFEKSFKEACLKEGDREIIELVCSSLIALPSPVPKVHLAKVLGKSIESINDIVADLPGLRHFDNNLGFLDEDVEYFVREKAKKHQHKVNLIVAEYLYQIHESVEYAAIHIAGALFSSGQGDKVIELIERQKEPRIIKDQIVRRQVQRQRLRLAMKVCTSTGRAAEAIFTLLVGAEAIKTDEAVEKILIENPDLSVHFATDTIGRKILSSPDMYHIHGSFLSHIIARDAHEKDLIAVREKKPILRAWFNKRREFLELKETKRNRSNDESWDFEIEDISALAYSIFITEGISETYHFIMSWTPKHIRFDVSLSLIERLLLLGKYSEVRKALDHGIIPEYWSAILSIPLALSGHSIDIKRLEVALCNKTIFKYFDLNNIEHFSGNKNSSFKYFEYIIVGCEILVANNVNIKSIHTTLEAFFPQKWRLLGNIHTHNVIKNDLSFRAFSLVNFYSESDFTFDDYWLEPEPLEYSSEKEAKEAINKIEKIKAEKKEQFSTLFTVYVTRAKILLSKTSKSNVENELSTVIQSCTSDRYGRRKEYRLTDILHRLSLTIGALSIVPEIDKELVHRLVKLPFKNGTNVFSVSYRETISFLLKIPSLQSKVLSDIFSISESIVSTKTAAHEKIDSLLGLSRLLLFVDELESGEMFKLAVDIANDVDVDAMYEVSLFKSLAKNSKSNLSSEESYELACSMAKIITEYGTLLEGYENFPWDDGISAIAILHMPKAVSLVGYWEELELSTSYELLPPLLSTGLSSENIGTAQAISMLNFGNEMEEDLLNSIVITADQDNINSLVEEVSRSELLRFNLSGRKSICEAVNKIIPKHSERYYWQTQLNQTISFKEKNKTDLKETELKGSDRAPYLSNTEIDSLLFQSVDSFIGYIDLQKERIKKVENYITSDELVKTIAYGLSPSKRLTFLNVLIEEKVISYLSYSWAETLFYCLEPWLNTSHSINAWKNDNLPILISKNLNEFARDISYKSQKPLLVKVINTLELDESEITDVLLKGIEKSSDSLPISSLYSLIELLSNYCNNSDFSSVTLRYVKRVEGRLNLKKDIVLDNSLATTTVENSFAKLIYSFLGDVDLRIRWRAAHSIRASVRMGHFQLITSLTDLYDQKEMPGYREANKPFYWLSARLWLVITFDRIASECPVAISPISNWLIQIATDNNFPHSLLRHFAKSCLLKLITNGLIDVNNKELEIIHSINISPMKEEKSDVHVSRGGFNQEHKDRRFRFDSLDTLRYVYPSAIACFAHIEEDQFLTEAENWIIDKWGKDNEIWLWDEEPRKNLFNRADYGLYSHSHGAMPTLERQRYHLEWHAMWCSLGSLMSNHALSKPKYDDGDYGTLPAFLRHESLTQPPLWSSDIRTPPPLEQMFIAPPDLPPNEWVKVINEDDFKQVLGLFNADSKLTVDCYFNIVSENHRSTMRVSSALVNVETGISLVKALQTSDDSHDYRLPPAKHDFEIDDGEYQLIGWLNDNEGDTRIDEKDTFSNGIGIIKMSPADNVISSLGLNRNNSAPISWTQKKTEKDAFIYEAWSDLDQYSRKGEYIYGDTVYSDGYRLKASIDTLKEYLEIVKFDLIVEIEITKREVKNGNTSYDQKSKKESRYSRIYLLRATGEIYTAEGCIGSWTSSIN